MAPVENTQLIDSSRRQNARNSKIALNWNASGTRGFGQPGQFSCARKCYEGNAHFAGPSGRFARKKAKAQSPPTIATAKPVIRCLKVKTAGGSQGTRSRNAVTALQCRAG